MAKQKLLGRFFSFLVNTGTEAAPVYTQVGGINSGTIDWDTSDADVTDFYSGGWNESLTAERGASLSLEGMFVEDPVSTVPGERDAGQLKLEDQEKKFGYDDQIRFRVSSSKSAKVIIDGLVRTEVAGPTGGGQNDPVGWTADLAFFGSPFRYVT